MGIIVRVRGGGKSGTYRISDDLERVAFGRDPDRCQVVFDKDATMVGREHCALERVLGRYRLVLNGDNLVLLDGKPAFEGQELPPQCTLQLGPGGPECEVRRTQREDLPGTIEQGHRPGEATRLVQASALASRNRTLVGLVALVVAAAIGLGIWAFTGTTSGVQEVKDRLDKEGDRIASVDAAIGAMQSDLSEVRGGLQSVSEGVGGLESAVGDMRQRFDDVQSKITALEPRLREALRKARPSVYLVIKQATDGNEDGQATAWVVGDGLLATNAHVADLFGDLEAGERLLVRSSGDSPRTYRVSDVRIHPGYKQFSDLWQEYDPIEGTTAQNASRVYSAGPACDVALLYLESPWEGLDPPLEIADDERLLRLDAGEPVGLVGYPMEGMVLRGTPVKRPTPQVQIGSITAVTSFFGAHGDAEEARREQHLIQHNCPSTGGASGSPILDAEGRVIAIHNAGNSIRLARNLPRLPTGAGVNFGQRVDLLREIIAGVADERQRARVLVWQREMESLYASGYPLQREASLESARREIVAYLEDRSAMASAYTLNQVSQGTLDTGTDTAPAPGTVDVPAAGIWLLLVSAERQLPFEPEIQFTPRGGQPVPYRVVSKAPWLWVCLFETAGPGVLTVRATAREAGRRILLHLDQAIAQPMTTTMLRERLVRWWLLRLAEDTDRAWVASQVDSAAPTLDARAAFQASTRLPPGTYLLLGVSPTREPIDMRVTRAVDGYMLREDTEPDHYPWCRFRIEDPTEIVITVVGGNPGSTFELHIFEAKPAQ